MYLETFITFILLLLSSYSTSIISEYYLIPISIASCIVGLIGSVIGRFKKLENLYFDKVIYTGSFIGMTSSNLIETSEFFVTSSLIACTLFILSKNILNEFGGKLGTLAFLSVALTFGIKWIF